MIRFILLQAAVWFFTITNAMALDQKDIDLFKFYLKEIKNVAAEFQQVDSQGVTARGKLLISKPFKFRCNYYSPFPLVIIGNKNYISVYDYDMEQLSRIKSEENVFNFLLDDDIEFEKHFTFEDGFNKDGFLTVTLHHSQTDRRSKIIFNTKSKYLESIEIFEGSNTITLKFYSFFEVEKFDDDLFILRNPDIFGAPSRLSKEDLDKKYKIIN